MTRGHNVLSPNFLEPWGRYPSTPKRASDFVTALAKLGVIAGVLLLAAAASQAPATARLMPVSAAAAPRGFAIAPGMPGLTPTPSPTCVLAWRTVPSPNPGIDDSLYAVAALSSSDVWAVGNNYDGGPVLARTLTMHWDGTQWSVVPSPNPGSSHWLTGVAAPAANDVWAVGHYTGGGAPRTLILHWDGAEWSIVSSPNPSPANWLTGIAAVSPTDIWASGWAGTTPLYHTMALHWDGTQWSVVPTPNITGGDNHLYGIAASGPNDVWAVGDHRIGGGPLLTLTMHWDGSAWTIVPSPNFGTGYNSLNAAAALGTNDAWAVGYSDHGTLTMHWDSTEWSRVPSSSPRAYNNLLGIAAVGANDIWVTGWQSDDHYSYLTLTEHWDGSAWSLVTSANVPSYSNQLSGVSAPQRGSRAPEYRGPRISSTDVWAVGGYGGSSGGDNPLAERYSEVCGPACCPVPEASGTCACYGFRAYAYDFTITSTCELSATARAIVNFEISTSPNGPWTTFLGTGYFTTIIQPGSNTLSNIMGITPPNTYYWFRAHLTALEINGCWTLDAVTPSHPICNYTPTPTRNYTPTYISTRTPGPSSPTATFTPTRTYTPTYSPSSTPSRTPGPSSPTATLTPTPLRATATLTPTTTPVTPIPTPVTSTATATVVAPCMMSFSDVIPSDYFHEAVRYLYCRGAISGYADNTFRPYNYTTRGQLSKIVVLAAGWTLDCPQTGHFSDVTPANPFYCVVETAYSHGIIAGYADRTFRPGNNVTRGQLAKIIALAEQWSTYTPPAPTFRDLPASDPFYSFVETAGYHGVISGYGCGPGCLEFRPVNSATRGQICKVVYQAITRH